MGSAAYCGLCLKISRQDAVHRHAQCMPMHLPYSTRLDEAAEFRGPRWGCRPSLAMAGHGFESLKVEKTMSYSNYQELRDRVGSLS